jgi:hypothetical protein
VDEEGFTTAPYTIEDLLISRPHGAGGVHVEVTREPEGVTEEKAVEGGGALEDIGVGVKEHLGFC